MNARIILATLLLATGCVSVKTSLTQPLPALPPGKGVVVFSTGANESSRMNVVLLRLEKATKAGNSTSSTDINVNNGYDRSDFKDEHGQVRFAVLDPGAYCFYPTLANPYLTFKGTIPNVAFRVKEGTATYIGSIYMDGLVFSVRNREQRDVEKALAARAELKKLPRATALGQIVKECRD